MFIKEVVKKNKGYEKTFVYHQLVESYRTEKGPRQRHLLDLGKLSIPKSKWKNLANRIEEIISGQTSIIAEENEIEALAQHYASLLIHKDLKQIQYLKEEQETDYETIDVNSIKSVHARSIGDAYVALMALKKLGLDGILKDLGFNERDLKIAELLIIARMVYPASEWATLRWAKEMSAIDELLDMDISTLSHSKLYRISDKLLEHKAALEDGLSEKERTLFSLEEKVILYDLTNTYFESSQSSTLKQRGRSKEKRNDQPQVTLGLVLDEDGFPKQSHIFKGNISEPGTLKKVLDQLSQGHRKLIIMDAGIASEANLGLIKSRGHDYLVVSRKHPAIKINEEDLKEIHHDQRNQVKAYLYRTEEELYLYCHSLLKKEKEASIRRFHQERFEADLKYASESLHKKRGTKKYSKVLERIGRIKEKHSKIAYFYDIQIKEQDGLVTEISWKLKDDQRLDERFSGSYFLRTSRLDLSEQEIWKLYISLTDVEDSFRSMKSELGLRPNFHQKDSRIEGHIFITVLAYHVLLIIQKYLHREDVYMRWATIRDLLSVQQRITTEMKTKDGRIIRLRQTTEPESFHYMVSNALKISPKPLGIKKQKI
ncbi:IS1634 family transposase [candidate division KSB1 bacterium]|nr:MAG: IS1634 family transposase [candidate division KSB1 bacterium]